MGPGVSTWLMGQVYSGGTSALAGTCRVRLSSCLFRVAISSCCFFSLALSSWAAFACPSPDAPFLFAPFSLFLLHFFPRVPSPSQSTPPISTNATPQARPAVSGSLSLSTPQVSPLPSWSSEPSVFNATASCALPSVRRSRQKEATHGAASDAPAFGMFVSPKALKMNTRFELEGR